MANELQRSPVLGFLTTKKAALLGAVPRTLAGALTWESIIQGVGLAIAGNPKLAECDPASVYISLLHIVRLGLDPSGMTQQAYLVPFWDGRRKCNVCTPMIGQQGKIELAYRSGRISRIITGVIHERDEYALNLADGSLSHSIDLLAPDRGKAVGAYCRIWLEGNPDPILEVMTLADFEKIKAAANKKNKGKLSPAYKAWPEEMWRRSVLSRALKRAPKSADLLEVMSAESDLMKRRESGDIVDVDWTVSTGTATDDDGRDAIGLPRGNADTDTDTDTDTDDQQPTDTDTDGPPFADDDGFL